MDQNTQISTLITGPWFEDLKHGLEFDAPAVTLTTGHASLHQSLSADRLRLPLNHHASKIICGHKTGLLHPLLAINIAIGQSTWATQRVKANLLYRGLVLYRPIFLGDTLYTRTCVVGMKKNRLQPGRAATGIVALEITTTNQNNDVVLNFWRFPMIPCRNMQSDISHDDNLDTIGTTVSTSDLKSAVPKNWALKNASKWLGLRAKNLGIGQQFTIDARDTITSAPELVRASLNIAMTHTDEKLSYLDKRLVFGGHTISICFAQITRALPNLLTIIAWEQCDHTAPVFENDRIRSAFSIGEICSLNAVEGGGSLIKIHALCYAARGSPEIEEKVLDWTFWAWGL